MAKDLGPPIPKLIAFNDWLFSDNQRSFETTVFLHWTIQDLWRHVVAYARERGIDTGEVVIEFLDKEA